METGRQSILDVYMKMAGKSEIPHAWHRWSCMSLVAATVADRVYYRKFAWEKLSPNMYVFLVGPSGLGKGGALGFAMQFRNPSMPLQYGACTHKSLVDKMATPTEHFPEPHKLYIVQAELADAIGSGPLADAFVKAMTDWYNPSSVDFDETTRTHGEKSFPPPCLNWLAGTTSEWLGQTVDPKAMMSGFFGRVAIAPGEYRFEDRVYDPSKYTPADYDDLLLYVYNRLEALNMLEGEFKMTQDARELDEYWYDNRPPPPSKLMAPFWRREHDLTLKIAMILSLCEGTDLIIKKHHVMRAQEEVRFARLSIPRIITEATQSKGQEKMQLVRDHMARRAEVWVSKSTLMREMKVIEMGMLPAEFDVYMSALEQMGELEIRKKGRGTSYKPCRPDRTFSFGGVKEDEPIESDTDSVDGGGRLDTECSESVREGKDDRGDKRERRKTRFIPSEEFAPDSLRAQLDNIYDPNSNFYC